MTGISIVPCLVSPAWHFSRSVKTSNISCSLSGLAQVCSTEPSQPAQCRVVEDQKCETQYLLSYERICVPGPVVCFTVEEEEEDCQPACQTQYETVQERLCSPVSDEICRTTYQETCRTEPGEDCGEEGGQGGQVCSTVYDIVSNIKCSQIEEKQCRTFYVPECETVQGL